MARGNEYDEKKKYVASLESVLYPIQDFGRLYYAHGYNTDAEYIGIYDILGSAVYLDVTGKSLSDIFIIVSKVIMGEAPDCIIDDVETKRIAVGLFSTQYNR